MDKNPGAADIGALSQHTRCIMGMRINGSGAANSAGAANWQARQQNVKTMMAAIQSGDLGSAQKAMAALNPSGQADSKSPFAAISKALQAGDIGAAQQAAQAFQAKRAGHHRGGLAESGGIATAPTTSAAAPLADSGPGSLINLVA